MIGIPQIATGLFAIGTGVSIVREVDKLHNIIFLVRFSNPKHIDICLYTRFADKQIDGHLDACKKSMLF